jgi:hypothetical protein
VSKRISLETWLIQTYGEDAPGIQTARRWCREGLIQPFAEKHGRSYYVVPDAKLYRLSRRRKKVKAFRLWRIGTGFDRLTLTALYRAEDLGRVPAWADLKAIDEIYRAARAQREATGGEYQVDHVVPLQGELVSGLHVHYNLQVLPKLDNILKKNRFAV